MGRLYVRFAFQNNNAVQVIWHHHACVQFDIAAPDRDAMPLSLHYSSGRRKHHRAVHDVTQKGLPPARANRDEIKSRGSVIPCEHSRRLDAVLLPKLHRGNPSAPPPTVITQPVVCAERSLASQSAASA